MIKRTLNRNRAGKLLCAAFTVFLAQAGISQVEDIAFFEKTYKTRITGVRPIKEYPEPDMFYTAIADQLDIPGKALAAAKERGWKEATEKIQKTDIKRLSAPPRWQVTLLQIKLDRETKRVDPESTELMRFELDDEGKAQHIELPKQEEESLKAKEEKTFDGVLSMMSKAQKLMDENPDQDPMERALEIGEKFSELLEPVEAEVLQELMREAPAPGDKVPSPPLALAPSGLTLVVCDSSNKVLDTIVIPMAQESITYRISVPKGMVEVRAFAIGKGRTLEWLREDLTENYCEARTDDKGSNDWGRIDATVKDFEFKGFSGVAGTKPLKLTDEMRSQIEKDIAEDKRSPIVTIISKDE